MASKTETRNDKLQAAHDKLQEAVAEIVSGDEWKRMLQLASKFHRYSSGGITYSNSVNVPNVTRRWAGVHEVAVVEQPSMRVSSWSVKTLGGRERCGSPYVLLQDQSIIGAASQACSNPFLLETRSADRCHLSLP